MNEMVAGLDPQTDASASPVEELQPGVDRDPTSGRFIRANYVDDSIDTAPIPEEAEAEEVEVVEDLESEVDPSPTDVEAVDENAETDPEYGAKAQARMDELVGNYRGEQRENEELRRELAQANERLAAIPVNSEPMKTLEDFGFDGAEYSKYVMAESAKNTEASVRKILQEHDDKRSSRDKASAFRQDEQKFEEAHPDYTDKVYGEKDGVRGWAATDVMAREIRMTENGHELAYHLATNPSVADKIASMPERSAILAMDQLHRKLESGKAEVAAAKKKPSKAPSPTPKIAGGDAGIKPKGYHEGMSDDAFDAMRRKEIAAR